MSGIDKVISERNCFIIGLSECTSIRNFGKYNAIYRSKCANLLMRSMWRWSTWRDEIKMARSVKLPEMVYRLGRLPNLVDSCGPWSNWTETQCRSTRSQRRSANSCPYFLNLVSGWFQAFSFKSFCIFKAFKLFFFFFIFNQGFDVLRLF